MRTCSKLACLLQPCVEGSLLQVPPVVCDQSAAFEPDASEVDVTEEVQDEVLRRQLHDPVQELLVQVRADHAPREVVHVTDVVIGELDRRGHQTQQRRLVLEQHTVPHLLVVRVEPRVEAVPGRAATQHGHSHGAVHQSRSFWCDEGRRSPYPPIPGRLRVIGSHRGPPRPWLNRSRGGPAPEMWQHQSRRVEPPLSAHHVERKDSREHDLQPDQAVDPFESPPGTTADPSAPTPSAGDGDPRAQRGHPRLQRGGVPP